MPAPHLATHALRIVATSDLLPMGDVRRCIHSLAVPGNRTYGLPSLVRYLPAHGVVVLDTVKSVSIQGCVRYTLVGILMDVPRPPLSSTLKAWCGNHLPARSIRNQSTRLEP